MADNKHKKESPEQDGTFRKRAKENDSHRAGMLRQPAETGFARFLQLARQAGNAALNRLLGRQSSGQGLEAKTRAEMEYAFGADFSGVQVHRDSESRAAAETLHAKAFTRGTDIYLGSEAPAPETPAGKKLLAHELAHVVQQQNAVNVEPARVSRPAEKAESDAEAAAHSAVQGRTAHVPDGGAVPAIQRQEQRDVLTRAEVQAMLTDYLRAVLQNQGGRNLRVTDDVRFAVQRLVANDALGSLNIEAYLRGTAFPGDPAEFAAQVARRLPETIEAARAAHLSRGPARQRTTRFQRVRQLAESTAPAEPTPEQQIAQWRFDQEAKQLRSGEDAVGPFSVDVWRAGRIISGLPEAIRGPQPAQPEMRDFPEVERGIQELISADALVPGEIRQRQQQAERAFEFAGPREEESLRRELRATEAVATSFADAREVARGLAQEMDRAHRSRQNSVELRLGDNYNQVTNRRSIFSELERIALLVRRRLPQQAAGVRTINVYFGDRLVRMINLSLAAERRQRAHEGR